MIDSADTPLPLGPIDKPTLAPLGESGLRWALMRQVVTGLAGTVGVLAYTRLPQPEDLGVSALTGAVLYFVILFALDRRGFKQVAKMARQVVLPQSIRARLAEAWLFHHQMAHQTQRNVSE